MVRYGSSRVCLIFLSFGTTWTSKAQALLPQVLFCVVLSYSGTFQYIHIIILVLRMNIRIYSRIILEVTLGNWSRMSRLWSLFSTLRSSLVTCPVSLSPQSTPLNFAHASWTTSRCATHRLVFFACYRSSQTGKDCPKLVNTISKLFHSNSYQFHLNFTIEYHTFLRFEVPRLMDFFHENKNLPILPVPQIQPGK